MAQPNLLDAASARRSQLIVDSLDLIACESPSDDAQALEWSARIMGDLGQVLLGQKPEIVRENRAIHALWRLGRAVGDCSWMVSTTPPGQSVHSSGILPAA